MVVASLVECLAGASAMSTSRHSSRPTFLRNAFALEARGTRASTFKDKRTPRGGCQNWDRVWLEEAVEEREPGEIPDSMAY